MLKQIYESAVKRNDGASNNQFTCPITCRISFQSRAIISAPAIRNRATKIKAARWMTILDFIIVQYPHQWVMALFFGLFQATVRIL
jgi:hypothetical protein